MIVDFLEGDPDRPIIVGRVYNAEQMPPYALPANMTQSGIKSRSSQGRLGRRTSTRSASRTRRAPSRCSLHAQKNYDIEVENDETHWVGHDRTKTIDNDETMHVKHDRTETVDNNETITIHGARTRNGRQGRVDHDQRRAYGVGGQGRECQISGARARRSGRITPSRSATRHRRRSARIRPSRWAAGRRSRRRRIAPSRRRLRQRSIKKDLALKAGTSIAIEGNTSIELKVGQNSIKIDQSGITIKGMKVKIEGTVMTEVKGLMTNVKADAHADGERRHHDDQLTGDATMTAPAGAQAPYTPQPPSRRTTADLCAVADLGDEARAFLDGAGAAVAEGFHRTPHRRESAHRRRSLSRARAAAPRVRVVGVGLRAKGRGYGAAAADQGRARRDRTVDRSADRRPSAPDADVRRGRGFRHAGRLRGARRVHDRRQSRAAGRAGRSAGRVHDGEGRCPAASRSPPS